MVKEFDKQVLYTTIMGVVESTFDKMCHVKFGAEPIVVEKDILEYNSRMRVFPMEKFNGPAYVASINYYLSQKDLENENAIGTFVLFVKEDVAEKLLRAFGYGSRDAENESLLFDNCGEFCNVLAGNVKNELVGLNYADLTMSAPSKYKNAVPEGVQFDYSLFKKQEVTFTFWGQKCIVVEACMGWVPQKAR